MELTEVKPKLVICLIKQGDSVPEEEKDSRKAFQHFLNNRVGPEQLTQMVDYSKRLTIVLNTVYKMYMRKTHPVNSNPS